MSTPISPVAICSNALLMLGAQTISNFDDKSDRARLASNLYDVSRDQLLREHPWSCAIKRVVLAPDVEKPLFDFNYQYTLPADLLRVLSIGEQHERLGYRIEGRNILSNENSLKLRYVFQNEDVTTYDSNLIDLLTLLMASKMAYAITQSTSMAQFKKQEYELALKVAKAVNGLEYPPETMGESNLLWSRF